MASSVYDAIVVGAGPNGLTAAIALAMSGCRVLLREAHSEIGGGCRSAQLTLPGFIHDVCSAVHPMGDYSPIFRAFELERHGLAWVHPGAPLAHALERGQPVFLERSLPATAAGLGSDGAQYMDLMSELVPQLLRVRATLLHSESLLRQAISFAPSAMNLLMPATRFVRRRFDDARTRALFMGLAAHSFIDLDRTLSNAVGLVLAALAHISGWPVARGGSQSIALALAEKLLALGGEIQTDAKVTSLASLPPARAVLLDVAPRQVLQIAGTDLPQRYCRALEKFQHCMAAYKLDWALTEPIPWRESALRRAGTVHLGDSDQEIATAERDVLRGQMPTRPFVILSQPSLFDATRSSSGATAWAYAHVPLGYAGDVTDAMEDRIEILAPGFRQCIRARYVTKPRDLEAHNPNLVGGDISGGAMTLNQLLRRPTLRWWSTPMKGLYLCSASTPPGPGVHGLCGYFAARRALRDAFPRRFLTNLDDSLASSSSG